MERERIQIKGESIVSHDCVRGKLEIVALENDTLVLKEGGRHVYSGQGRPWRYAGARFRVYRIERNEPLFELKATRGKAVQIGEETGRVLTCTELTSWPVRP